jgi:hypothetical protein
LGGFAAAIAMVAISICFRDLARSAVGIVSTPVRWLS